MLEARIDSAVMSRLSSSQCMMALTSANAASNSSLTGSSPYERQLLTEASDYSGISDGADSSLPTKGK